MTTLGDIAATINGHLIGDGNIPIHGIAGIQTASEGEITFLTHASYAKYLTRCKASGVIIGKKTSLDDVKGLNVIVVDNPDMAYIRAAEMFFPPASVPPGIDRLAHVSEGADIAPSASIRPFACIESGTVIGERAVIHSFAYIGTNCVIGEGTVIHPHVTIYRDTQIGRNVTVHANTVIGCDGFGYTWDGSKHAKIPQIGRVVIEDDVEIGSNTSIDRASLGTTVIGKGTKVDNLVQIAHNVTIGQNSIIVSQVGIAGSSHIGSNVVLAGQVGVKDHTTVGDGVMAGGGTGITKDVPPGSLIWGTPHAPHKEWMKLQIYIKKLPTLFERIKKLEKKLLPEDNDDRHQ